MDLNKNYTTFIFTFLMCIAPTSLVAPFLVYDHDNCIPRNFIVDLNLACKIQICCFLITVGPLVLLFFTPKTLRTIFCCNSCQQQKISPQENQENDENAHKYEFQIDDKTTTAGKLSYAISLLLNILTVLATIALLLVLLLIHIATYRLF